VVTGSPVFDSYKKRKRVGNHQAKVGCRDVVGMTEIKDNLYKGKEKWSNKFL